MQESFFKQLISKPPILFPLAALFHIIITLSAIISLYPTPLTQSDWLRPLSMVLCTILSIGLCTLKRIFAIAYVALSIACLGMFYFSLPYTPMHLFGGAFFPINLILSFFLLLFFKKFNK